MSSDIELRALLVREGTLLLLRPQGAERWELPGGPFMEDHRDVDWSMGHWLDSIGIHVAEIDNDFLQTAYVREGGPLRVVNFYAPREWTGEPLPAGGEARWVPLDELTSTPMDDGIRKAALITLGLAPEEDETAGQLAAVLSEPVSARRNAGLDVLRTLSGGDAAAAAAGLERRLPEIAGDIIDFALGEVWSGPALDRRTRSLEVVAMLAALGGRAGALRSHLNGALNHGATPEQLVQTLRMVAVYAGFPVALEAWPVMEEVFAARGIPRPGREP